MVSIADGLANMAGPGATVRHVQDRSCHKIGKTDQSLNVSERRSSRCLVKIR
jgi:hypothetical protein